MSEKTKPSSNTKKRRTNGQELIDKARIEKVVLESERSALQNILNVALSRDAYPDWDSIKRSPYNIPFKKEPKLEDYVPAPPDDPDNIPPIQKMYFEQQYANGEQKYLAAKATYDTRVKDRREKVNRSNQKIERLKKSFPKGKPRAVKSYFNKVLHASTYPFSFPKKRSLDYTAESRHLIVEYELPGMDIMIGTAAATRHEIQLSGSVIAQIALRTLHEIFQADRTEKVNLIWFTGYVKVTDKITNQEIQLHVVRINIIRHQFLDIDLHSVDPLECLKGLDKKFSRNLDHLVAVSYP